MGISVKRIGLSVLMSHLVGMVLLILLSCIALMLPYPVNTTKIIGILAFSFGAAFLGFRLRGKEIGAPEAILSGALYGGVTLISSLFGKGEATGVSYRLILFAVSVLLAVLPLWLFKKRKKRKRAYRR